MPEIAGKSTRIGPSARLRSSDRAFAEWSGPGDRIGFEVREDGTIVVHAERAERVGLMSLRGVLKPNVLGVTVEQMNQTIRKVTWGT
ncbi:MAG: hypothetical protein WCI05_01395 [Myxococcales bacterium]|jgi:hypothetical protein